MTPTTVAPAVRHDVSIALRGFDLPGRITIPSRPRGLVMLAHEAGRSGSDARDRVLTDRLLDLGFGTLELDLLAPHEVGTVDGQRDLDVLAVRLLVATRWLRAHESAGGQPVGYFGSLSGAAVALLAAAEDPAIGAVVARSGRLDLAGPCLPTVQAPTLLIVGGADSASREVNERAESSLRCAHELVLVPRATELFAEPGTFETAARLTGAWFVHHLRPNPTKGETT